MTRCERCGGSEANVQGCLACCRDCGFPCGNAKDGEAFHAEPFADLTEDDMRAMRDAYEGRPTRRRKPDALPDGAEYWHDVKRRGRP